MSEKVLIPLCAALGAASFWATGIVLEKQRSSRPAPGAPVHAAASAEVSPGAPDGAGGEASPPESLAQLREAVVSQRLSPEDTRLALWEALGRLSPDALGALISAELSRTSQPFTPLLAEDWLLEFAARRLSERDPHRAAELWRSAKTQEVPAAWFLSIWMEKNPAGFLHWCTNLTREEQEMALGALGNSSPESEARLADLQRMAAGTTLEGPLSEALLQHRYGPVLEAGADLLLKGDPAAALELVNSLPDGVFRRFALLKLALNPGVHPATQPEVREVLSSLSGSDAKIQGWILEKRAADLPPGEVRQAAERHQFNKLAEKDPAAAARELVRLGPAEYPAAVRDFVQSVVHKNPAEAADWALSIPVGAMAERTAALEMAAKFWFRADPGRAREWVESAPLSDREYFALTGERRKAGAP